MTPLYVSEPQFPGLHMESEALSPCIGNDRAVPCSVSVSAVICCRSAQRDLPAGTLSGNAGSLPRSLCSLHSPAVTQLSDFYQNLKVKFFRPTQHDW